ncbi:MAG: YicC family protein [Lachnospiraceae bacterium]|nr:YicC family protein [Lachnospiraceae bacterium]
MIRSMTGFGRMESTRNEHKIIAEVKSVNHRYLDVNIRMPKTFNEFDARLRNILKEYVQRGKVDLFITCEDQSENRMCVRYNSGIAADYMKALEEMSAQFSLPMDVRVQTLAKFPEVLTLEEKTDEEEELWPVLEEAFRGACEKLSEARALEGEQIRTDLLKKLAHLEDYVEIIEAGSPKIIQEYRSKLEERVKEFLADSTIDSGRIAAEVTIFADKVCVDEEIVRLKSHIETMRNCLLAGGAIGRKLDFLSQEMLREANTILSKSSDLKITDCGIEIKTEIEKIREQVQNIE